MFNAFVTCIFNNPCRKFEDMSTMIQWTTPELGRIGQWGIIDAEPPLPWSKQSTSLDVDKDRSAVFAITTMIVCPLLFDQ